MRPFRFAALACLLLSCASALLLDRGVGLAQSGGTFDLSRFTVDNGGGAASAGSFTLGATLGQPDAGSPASGGTFSLRGGFWRPAVHPTAPGEVTDLRASNAEGRLRLDWTAVTYDPSGVTYRVYRGTNSPYFEPTAPPYEKDIIDPTYPDRDPNAIGDTAAGHYYVVTAVNGAGLESAPSNRVGTIAFPLAPGN